MASPVDAGGKVLKGENYLPTGFAMDMVTRDDGLLVMSLPYLSSHDIDSGNYQLHITADPDYNIIKYDIPVLEKLGTFKLRSGS